MRSVRVVDRRIILECALLTLLLLVPSIFFVTKQSLWIDEIYSVWFADHAVSLNTNRWHFLLAVPEMPVFHVLLTGWVHLFGDSERAVRSINLPFAALFLGSITWICRLGGARRYWLSALPFAFFPMLTYYVNECRPYTALLGLAAASAAAFLYSNSQIDEPTSRAPEWWCSFFALAAFSMHMLGILVPIALLFFLVVSREQRRRFLLQRRRWVLPIAATLPGYGALLFYYARVHGEGVVFKGAVPNPETPTLVASSWKNIAFFFYEMFGFDGLGPPRNDMRIHAAASTFFPYIFWMLPALVACALVAFLFWRLKNEDSAQSPGLSLLYAALLGLGFLFLIARAIHFGFLGRHSMGLMGIFCCAVALALSNTKIPESVRNTVAATLCIVWALSSFRLLLLYPYGKDDTRAAVRAAIQTHLPILWNADEIDAAYYDGIAMPPSAQIWIPATYPTGHWRPETRMYLLQGSGGDREQELHDLRRGAYVMVSGKPDIFDPSGFWSGERSRWQPVLIDRYNGFDLWKVTVP